MSATITAAILRSLLTNGSVLPCSPLEIRVDGKVAELVDVKLRCKATDEDCNGMVKPAEIPTVVLCVRSGDGQ